MTIAVCKCSEEFTFKKDFCVCLCNFPVSIFIKSIKLKREALFDDKKLPRALVVCSIFTYVIEFDNKKKFATEVFRFRFMEKSMLGEF